MQCHSTLRTDLLSFILAKPVLVVKPENVSVRLGESAQFYCQAKGDPPPAVVWSRERGPLPNGRYCECQISSDSTQYNVMLVLFVPQALKHYNLESMSRNLTNMTLIDSGAKSSDQ